MYCSEARPGFLKHRVGSDKILHGFSLVRIMDTVYSLS